MSNIPVFSFDPDREWILTPVIRLDNRLLNGVTLDDPDRIQITTDNARCTYRLIEDDPCLDVSTWQAEGG